MGFDFGDVERLAADLTVAGGVAERDAVVVVERATTAIASMARTLAPVLTGDLVEHIDAVAAGLTGTVVSSSEHADYVEYGTSDTPAQPYMGPAFDAHERDLDDGLADAGERALR